MSVCFQTVAKVRGHPKNIAILSQQILGEGGMSQFNLIFISVCSPAFTCGALILTFFLIF